MMRRQFAASRLVAVMLGALAVVSGPAARLSAQDAAQGLPAAESRGSVPAPGYDELTATARERGETAPGPLAYRLVLRFAAPEALTLPGEFYRLARSAESALRFGNSAQDVGLRLRRMSALALASGPASRSLELMLRHEGREGNYPRAAFGGAERGAGNLGPGLGAPSWGLAGGSNAGIGTQAGTSPGNGSGTAHGPAGGGTGQ